MDKRIEVNPGRYRAMNQPHATQADAAAAVDKFFDGVSALRESCKIADVLIVLQTPYLDEHGGEVDAGTSAYFGDQAKAESLAAWALGQESARRQEYVARMARGAGRAIGQVRDK